MKNVKTFDEFVNESKLNESDDFEGPGLIVVGKSRKDNDLIDQATEESGFYGIYNDKENYWFFPEKGDQATIDRLENELETIFMKKGANVTYEVQYEWAVNESKFEDRIKMKKGFKITNEIEKLFNQYDFYVQYIDNYSQRRDAERKNGKIKTQLSKLGVEAIADNDGYFYKIK